MISGTVSARLEVIMRLRVRGTSVVELEFDAVIDTGFTSSLTLPATAVTALALVRAVTQMDRTLTVLARCGIIL